MLAAFLGVAGAAVAVADNLGLSGGTPNAATAGLNVAVVAFAVPTVVGGWRGCGRNIEEVRRGRHLDRLGRMEADRPPNMPEAWPENVVLTPAHLARAIRKLQRYRREIPGFYRRWRPGGPGRRPKYPRRQ